jgi:hypothetical protein
MRFNVPRAEKGIKSVNVCAIRLGTESNNMLKSTYEWECDLCTRFVKTDTVKLPKGWVELVFNVDADAKQLPVRHVCFMCAARIAEIHACQVTETSIKTGIQAQIDKFRSRLPKRSHKSLSAYLNNNDDECLNDNANECPMPGPGH